MGGSPPVMNIDPNYTPDFLLTHTDGTQKFIEVKPQSKIADEDFRARFIEK
ncbi:Tn7 transposase TnsA N-terminal domain-containing protein [Pseudoalteromonas ostreae]|uniref:Tn7 transposase TnsA N-terminal domain-containing protein n=1 Tax=Pseudoalteromonas ostreae TaxID=2774154 RepID=UPI001E5504DE|nr:Tn7 transposase TnsA N-terminal domain-containing protein [Pseudoalteromonas ostreae]